MANKKSDNKLPADNAIIDWGVRALKTEAVALEKASAKLNESFSKAVKMIFACHGKVATTGLGKSGHIARKISATFASTGTPSYYIHPTEALHGDFGMLSKSDCILAIAFGGETSEVNEVVNFARRLDLNIIAITGNPSSTLAKLSHCVLDSSVEKEACPLNLAPTSSSTLTMALGDALAVALMHMRGFSEKDFASLHPKGSLGRKLAVVSEYMRPASELSFVNRDAGFTEILSSLTKPNFGIVGVVDEAKKLVGAISDGDLRRALIKYGERALQKHATDLMSLNPKVVEKSDLTVDVIKKMETLKITSLFVVSSDNSKQVLGIIRLHDLIEAKVL